MEYETASTELSQTNQVDVSLTNCLIATTDSTANENELHACMIASSASNDSNTSVDSKVMSNE